MRLIAAAVASFLALSLAPVAVPAAVAQTAAPLAEGPRAQNWYDVCDDVATSSGRRGKLDLRSALVAQRSTGGDNSDQTGLLLYMCRPWVKADLGRITWYLRTNFEYSADLYPVTPVGTRRGEEFDYAVRLFRRRGQLEMRVYRTPATNPATWQLTWRTSAGRLDGHEVDGVFPTKALGGASKFDFFIETSERSGARDLLPERHEAVPTFPQTCADLAEERLTLSVNPGEALEAAASAREAGLEVSATLDQLDAVVVERPAATEQRRLGAVRGMTGAQAVAELQALEVRPNDPAYSRQWALPAVNAPAGWEIRRKSGVRVAVIDAGIDGLRGDLRARVVASYDAVEMAVPPASVGTSGQRNTDRGGHGTMVAGALAATGNNDRELAGIDWGARLLDVRASDSNGCFFDVSVAAGIVWAADRGAKVINVSVGGTDDSDVLRAAVEYAATAGAVVVAAAGNRGSGGVVYPAAYPGVIAVGATDRSNRRAGYSSTGWQLDVVAPGGSSNGTDGGVLLLADLRRRRASVGTSFATPLVSGAVALYRGRFSRATAADVRVALQDSARDLGTPGHDWNHGHGLLDLRQLLRTRPESYPSRRTP